MDDAQELLKLCTDIAVIATVIAVVTGAIGGLWSLSDRVKERRNEKPFGVAYIVTAQRRSDDGSMEVDYLISQNVFGFIREFRGIHEGVEVKSIEAIGKYFKATVLFPNLPTVDIGCDSNEAKLETSIV